MVDLQFLKEHKELYPYESNMRKFETDYNFTFGDGKKSTPKFCNYNGNSHVYLDKYIICAMAKTKEEKKKLINYVKENFKNGWDKKPELVRTKTEIIDKN